MTLVVVLLLGLGAVLVVSAIETDPTTGKSVSVIQTAQDIWANNVNFAQPSVGIGNSGATGPGHNPGPGLGGAGGAFADTLAHRASLVREHVRFHYGA